MLPQMLSIEDMIENLTRLRDERKVGAGSNPRFHTRLTKAKAKVHPLAMFAALSDEQLSSAGLSPDEIQALRSVQ